MTIGKALIRAAGVGLALLSAPALTAQTLITPDAFLDAAVGNTLSFHSFETGELIGTEQFLTRALSVWKQSGDMCVYGQIYIENQQLCFYYEDVGDGALACWWPFRHEGQLMLRFASFTNSEVQIIQDIAKDAISCPNPPLS